MVDTLHLEVPATMPFRADFAKAWNGPENEKHFQKTGGGLYLVASDLRSYTGIPARLSVGHRHHKKLGPKLEIFQAGDKCRTEWIETVEAIFAGDAEESAILRADLTGDVRGVPVGVFERAIYAKFKHTAQSEYGGPGERTLEELEELACSYSRFDAQTLYFGRKPCQLRIYDKTRHRLKVLLVQKNKLRRRAGLEPVSFFEEYGYNPREVVTRVERQMGAREPAKAFGVKYLGEIHRLMKCDPFERLQLAGDLGGVIEELEEIEGARRLLVCYIRDHIERTGLQDARAFGRAQFRRPASFRKFWAENEHLIFATAGPGVTRADLTAEFHQSLQVQLAA
jgi:hypothetical protein